VSTATVAFGAYASGGDVSDCAVGTECIDCAVGTERIEVGIVPAWISVTVGTKFSQVGGRDPAGKEPAGKDPIDCGGKDPIDCGGTDLIDWFIDCAKDMLDPGTPKESRHSIVAVGDKATDSVSV
jgi:hypothetical protein